MKHLVGFTCALLTIIVLFLLDKFVLKFKLPEFLIGWIGCTFYFIGKDGFEEFRNHF